MIRIEAAQARIFALKAPVETETVILAEALNRWAAADIVARRTQPARDLSAMDGFAVRFGDLPGPWKVIGESAAGRQFSGNAGPGEAVRIFTGAVVPNGADTVIIQEEVARVGDVLSLTGDLPSRIGQHVRAAGADFQDGAVVIPSGAELHARHLALAAMAGHDRLPVRRKLRVALLSTGDELVVPGQRCDDDQIPSSNAIMLAAMLRDLPVEIHDIGIVKDDVDSLTAAFTGLVDCDIIVTTGGASVGDHDLVAPALQAAGGSIDFWKIAMRPGKPVIAGKLANAIVLGLPGNPVSAFVTAFLLLLPLVRHLGGAADALPPRLTARLGDALPANGPRVDHLRAFLDDGVVTPIGVNDSAMLAALSKANALIIRNLNETAATAGDEVRVYPISV